MQKRIARRIMAWILSVCMIAGMVDLSGFTVRAEDDRIITTVEFKDSSIVYTYNGGEIKPGTADDNIVVKDFDGQEVPAESYDLIYENNTNASSSGVKARVTAAAKSGSGYMGSATAEFAIQPKNITDAADITVTVDASISVTSPGEVRPIPTVQANGSNLVATRDYTYTYTNNNISATEDEKTATVTIHGVGNYTGEKSVDFKIYRYDESKLRIVMSENLVNRGKPYTGSPVTLRPGSEFQVFYGEGDSAEEIPIGDYYDASDTRDPLTDPNATTGVAYRNNTYATTSARVIVIIKKGKYAGLSTANNTGKDAGLFTICKPFGATYIPENLRVTGRVKEDQSYQGAGTPVTLTLDDIEVRDPDYGILATDKYEIATDQGNNGYRNNTSVGSATDTDVSKRPTVIVRGIGGAYSGTMDVYFNIVAAQLTPGLIHVDASECVYDGTDQFDNLKVTVGDNGEYIKDVDFTVTRVGTGHTTAGTHSIRVSPTSNGQLLGEPVIVSYEIAARSLDDVSIAFANPSAEYIYNGSGHVPEMSLQYNGVNLRQGIDYTLNCTNNVDAGVAKATITGTGNYSGSRELEYTIRPLDLQKCNARIMDLETQTYTGEPIEASFLVRRDPNIRLYLNTDYEATYHNNTDIGTASITVIGKGNYTGTISGTFQIQERSINDRNVRISITEPLEYTGAAIKPPISISLVINDASLSVNRTLVEGTDYRVNFDASDIRNKVVGKGRLTITGINGYKDTTSEQTFTIEPRNINTEYLKVISRESGNVSYDFINTDPMDRFYIYNGESREPKFDVSYGGEGLGMGGQINGILDLVESDGDYEVKYIDSDKVGMAEAQITGKGNFTGTKSVYYVIKGCLDDYGQPNAFTEIEIPDQIYTRKAITPGNAKVTFAGKELAEGSEFIIDPERCRNNIEVTNANSKAVAIVEGYGDYYYGSGRVEFEILPLELNQGDDYLQEHQYTIKDNQDSYIYTGAPLTPELEITHTGDLLVEGTDYSLEYYKKDGENLEKIEASESIAMGSYVIRIVGDGVHYTGSKDIAYAITAYDFSAGYAKDDIEVTGIVDVIWDEIMNEEYTGDAVDPEDPDKIIQPGLQVMFQPDKSVEAKPLVKDTDYTLTYEKNNILGTATITINGIGNYEGTLPVEEFHIRGDLAGENVTITVDDWTYPPPKNGQSTNCPTPSVIYTIHRADGSTEELTLTDQDCSVAYQGNENATTGEEKAAAVVISAVENGDYLNSAEPVPFQVKQRDIKEAVSEEEGKLLSLGGLVEDGYEYNGQAQVPEFVISYQGAYAGTDLTSGTGDGAYDYEVSPINNVNVYTYGTNSFGEQERLHPQATISARKDAEGNYAGNYYGEFTVRFQINPREISDATVQVSDINERYAYTGDPIRPEVLAEAVTWSKGGEPTILVRDQDYTVSYGEAKDNIIIGEGKIEITAVPESNYAGTMVKTFRIMADLEAGRVSNPPYIILKSKGADPNEFEAPYGAGVKVYPDMYFEDWSSVYCGLAEQPKELQMGVDYEIVEERNNTDVGEKNGAYIRIRGKDYYMGEIEIYYTITPMDLSADEENHVSAEFRNSINDGENENAYIYTGEPITPEIIVRNRQTIMVPSRDYEIVRYENNTDISTEESKARVLIRGIEGTNYTGEKWFEFNIIPRTIENMTVTLDSEPQVFNRQEKRPGVEVSFRNENNQLITLTEGTDFDIAYANNILPATADSGEAAPTITITGKGAYGGVVTLTFTIEPESFAEENEDIIITGSNVFYTGEAVTTTFHVAAQDGTVLEENVDFEVGEYSDNLEPGTGYAEIRGIGNYTGSRKVPFLIVPPEGDFIIEDIPDQTYNTRKFEPAIQVSFAGEEITIPVTEGKDYQVEYGEGNTDVGTGTVRVVGINSFADIDAATKTFRILPKSMGTPDNPDPDMTLRASDQIYTGRGVKPEIQLTFRSGADVVTLEEGKDYTVNCSSNVAVGTATATVIGMGNYAGVMQAQFRVVGDLKDAAIAEIPIQEYTGQQIRPVPVVTFAGEELMEGTDYTVAYGENIEEGTGTITITGTDAGVRVGGKAYTGTREITFVITREREFSDATVVVGVAEAYPYTGEAIKPVVVRVEDNGKVLTEGTDYSVSYRDNINAGTASVVITGMDRYKGEKVQTFQIRPQQIARAKVAEIASQTYTGKEIRPTVKVQAADSGKALEEDKDYSIVYVNNKTPGKSSVIVRGMGNYTGAQTVSFNIQIPKVTNVKASAYSSSSVTFSWKSNPIVSGYDIYNSNNRPVARVEKGSASSGKVNKLKAATTATFRVRAFVIDEGQYYYGPFTSVKGTTAAAKPKIKSAASKKSKQAVIKWGKVSKATGYQVYRATSKNGNYKRIATTTKTSYTDKSAKGGRKYYYKVRTYRKTGGKNYYSSQSSAKSVTVKR